MRQTSLLLGLVTLAVASCGDGTGPDIAHTTFASALSVDLPTMTQTASGLYYKDLTVGNGALVATGQQVSIHYTGNLPSGTLFDANTAANVPLTFQLGAGQVIRGFDEGVGGMRVGGRRQVIIPPDLGYGSRAVSGIPANSILVFTIEVVGAQ